jgi:SAM-dependent methyltransferase
LDSVIEPLGQSAPLAWAEAPRLCHRDTTGETCVFYHRVWQYLRLLGVISTVGTNSDFLLDTFRDCARASRRRVLIAGTADYAMLARLISAYRATSAGERLDVTVLDRCRTSLFLNEWYARHVGVPIDIVCDDALAYAPREAFDLICTHNFLGRFDEDGRARLVDAWRRSLRPHGLVVTSLRIRPHSLESRVVYSDAQARAFGTKVSAAARASREPLSVSAEELGDTAYEYARRKSSYVITSNAAVTSLFTRSGFDVVLADSGGGLEERERDRPASLAGRDTYRMRLIARQR